MTVLKGIKDLEKYANKEIRKSLKEDVSKKLVKVAQEHVQKDVYDEYTPKVYNRTGELMDSFVVNDLANGIEIENTRRDGERYIPEIIEYGHDESEQGYTFAYHYPGGDNYIQPRPFIENTRQQIMDESIHVNELKKSLKSKGLDIK
ncbi:hypothetical protein P4597_26975 [Peribacillus simplex]|uniref:hypothetical protein n=1 Tax=Peribacillus simplex TaxID=1478 RepID=UPI002E207827|nr:hypothetical protein [Peribacillus simplex]